MIYKSIQNNLNKRKLFSLLIDPDKQTGKTIYALSEKAGKAGVDFILLGGSLISSSVDEAVDAIKNACDIPVILFPGSLLQISEKADGILLLSLISGRNPDFLIGNQVVAAPMLKKSGLEIIPTGYVLIDSGKLTSVEYMSNTKPIPSDKTDIAVATAIAGEMMGKKMIYLEAGSGALRHVPEDMIAEVKKNIGLPLIVGGGIRTEKNLEAVCRAGADIVVVGTALERNGLLLDSFANIIRSM